VGVYRPSAGICWRKFTSAREVDRIRELVVSEKAFEVLRSQPSYLELPEDIRENGGLDLYVYGGELLFSVWMYYEVVQVGIKDEERSSGQWWKARMVRFGSGGKTRATGDDGKRWHWRSSFRSSWLVRNVNGVWLIFSGRVVGR